jgi:hypothetical protein
MLFELVINNDVEPETWHPRFVGTDFVIEEYATRNGTETLVAFAWDGIFLAKGFTWYGPCDGVQWLWTFRAHSDRLYTIVCPD